jgi:curved DNA-binding protein CbpA
MCVRPQAVYPNAPQLLQSDSSSKATVSSSAVKKAYMKAARALHPDKVQAGSTGPDGQVITPQVAAKAAVLFTALAALYEDYKTKADT